MTLDPQDFFTRWIDALNRLDFEQLEQMIDPDVVTEYPQSGERVTGFKGWRQILEYYPGGLPRDANDVNSARVLGDSQRWMISPGYTVVPMSSPDHYTTTVSAAYPDGSRWLIVTLVEMRDGKICRLESYFAPELPEPLAQSIAAFPHG